MRIKACTAAAIAGKFKIKLNFVTFFFFFCTTCGMSNMPCNDCKCNVNGGSISDENNFSDTIFVSWVSHYMIYCFAQNVYIYTASCVYV